MGLRRRDIDAALRDTDGLARLQYLCDRIGNRLSGSASLERAIEWTATEMKKAGLENVRTPPVMVPKWARGQESATMLEPVPKPLWMIGYGMAPGTPPEGITADVVVVVSPDHLTARRVQAAGKIVLFIPNVDGYKPAVVDKRESAGHSGDLGLT
jgi:hypothetical protein